MSLEAENCSSDTALAHCEREGRYRLAFLFFGLDWRAQSSASSDIAGTGQASTLAALQITMHSLGRLLIAGSCARCSGSLFPKLLSRTGNGRRQSTHASSHMTLPKSGHSEIKIATRVRPAIKQKMTRRQLRRLVFLIAPLL